MTLNPEKQFNSTFTALRVAFCLAALFVVFSFCSFSKAECADNCFDIFQSDILQYNIHITSSEMTTLQNAFTEAISLDYGSVLRYEDSNYIVYYVTSDCNWCIGLSINSSTFRLQQFSGGYAIAYNRTGSVYRFSGGNIGYFFGFYKNAGNGDYLLQSADISYSSLATYTYSVNSLPKDISENYTGVRTSRCSFSYTNVHSSNYSFLFDISKSDVINGSSDLIVSNKISFGAYYNYEPIYLITDTWSENYPSAVEDDRLDIYSLYNNTGKDLVIDITKFDFSNYDGSDSATQNTLVDDKITITVFFDGNEQELVLDSSTSQILRNYVFKTPYSFFNLDNYNDVKLTKVTFSKLIHYRPNEMKEDETINYYISCEYWLKHLHEDVEPNDNPYANNVYGSVLTNSEKQALQYLIDFDHGTELTFSEYQGLNKPDFFEDDAVFVYLSDGGSLGELLEDIANIPLLGQYADMIASFINNIDDTIELQTAIYDYLYDNADTQTHSMIVFVYISSWTDWTAGTISANDLIYYYYITSYGRIRELNQTLADIYISTKQTENNVAAIFDEIDDFEDSFIDFYNMTIADNATALGWLSTINNYINNLDFPVFDDSSILDKLDDILFTLLGSVEENEIDTPQECVQFYLNHSNDDLDDINITLRPAFFEGATLDFLYNLVSEGEEDNTLRSSMRDGSSTSSFNILWKLYNIIRSVYRDSEAGETITFVLDDMGDSNSYYNALFRSDFDPNNWGYLYE